MMSTWAVLAALVGCAKEVEPETTSFKSVPRLEALALGPSLASRSPNSATSFSAIQHSLVSDCSDEELQQGDLQCCHVEVSIGLKYAAATLRMPKPD